jgi:stearoyl-CoA desaturase (Delta-9 desaturase)
MPGPGLIQSRWVGADEARGWRGLVGGWRVRGRRPVLPAVPSPESAPYPAPGGVPYLTAAAPARDDVQPVAHETVDRIATGSATVLPFLALGVAAWQAWGHALRTSDLLIFFVMYVATVLGVTVGFHRHFTHRSFKTTRPVRVLLAVLGSAAVEGPVISWVADHRKHHAFSDREGDPHSPHVGHGVGWRGALRGLFHAHLGWLFVHDQRGKRSRYAPDLLADRAMCFVDRTFLVWVFAGLAVPFGLGWAIGGSLAGALTGLLWGGAVRMLVLHHVTFSINSLCHFFGRRRFPTDDRSRNLAWLALPSMGEAWHNNHHAFPTSAAHGMRPWEVDPSALVIRALEASGLAWDVQRITRERQDRRYARASLSEPPS